MIADTFRNKIETFQQVYLQLAAQDKRLSLLRLLFFILALGLVIFLSSINWILSLTILVVCLVGFSRLLKYHNNIIDEKNLADITTTLNRKELQVLENDLGGFQDGVRFSDVMHSYVVDLDIFGTHSVFQLLSRCNTSFGEELLAKHLSHPNDKISIEAYQEAVQELEPLLDWRQRLFAIGQQVSKEQQDVSRLMKWVADGKDIGINRLVLFACLIISWCTFLGLMTILPWGTALVGFLPNAIFFYNHSKKVNHVHLFLDKHEKTLNPYAKLIAYVDQTEFNSRLLAQICTNLNKDGIRASEQLSRFAYLLKQLDMRTNFFGIIFNVFFLWENIYMLKIEKWRKQHQQLLPIWLDSLGKIEYCSSLANFAYTNPNFSYPKIVKHP